jgi:16S rRNA (guanine527-N7)-methyltransferase
VGGIVLLPKGGGLAAELDEARFALETLGGVTDAVPDGSVVIVEKTRPTPPAYPRRTGQPSKAPLLPR